MQNYKQIYGNEGENLAVDILEKNHFRILERNYRFGRIGEIDIIARKENLILFIEVKRRKSQAYGGTHYSISNKKKSRIRTTAEHFINSDQKYRDRNITYRFDLISIYENDIEWVEDIFR